jgi:hypothetical protein
MDQNSGLAKVDGIVAMQVRSRIFSTLAVVVGFLGDLLVTAFFEDSFMSVHSTQNSNCAD